jgi:hypothetical protein
MPATLILAGSVVAMGYYNVRVYGNALTLPYQAYRSTYAPAPVFLWQEPSPVPAYRHKVLRDFFMGYELATFERMTGEHGLGANWLICSARWWIFFLYPLSSAALLAGAWWLAPSKEARLPLLLSLIPAAGVGALAFNMAHYFAPAVAAFYVLLIQSMRLAHERLWVRRGVGRAIVRYFALVAVAMACVVPFHVHDKFLFGASWYYWFPPIPGRADVIRQLQTTPGSDLVIVRYKPGHDSFQEWVYNEADIDAAGIVWAREMEPDENRKLISYFRGREIWLLEADERPPRLVRNPSFE